MTDVERFADLNKKIDKTKTEMMQIEIEDANITKEMSSIEKELMEKFNISKEQIEEYKVKSEEKLVEVEKEINRVYEIIK